jgi:hypothetical protein
MKLQYLLPANFAITDDQNTLKNTGIGPKVQYAMFMQNCQSITSALGDNVSNVGRRLSSTNTKLLLIGPTENNSNRK